MTYYTKSAKRAIFLGSLASYWTSTRSFLIPPTASAFSSRLSDIGVALHSTTKGSNPDNGITINPIVAAVKPSKTVEVFGLVKQMEADGDQVTSLCVGEPDFPPPQAVLDAATMAIGSGNTRYTAVTGTIELRKAISADLKQRKGLDYDPLSEIIVGNGAKQCVFEGMLATCGQGDSVLVPAPYWPSYPEMARLTGAEPVIVETTAENGYLLTPNDLRVALERHPNCKMLVLCNPSNPTGAVYQQEQLEAIAAVLRDFPKVSIMADEIYERLVYEGSCTSFATLPGMFERTLTINGFSKAYAMTGMRLGYIAAPRHLAKAVSTIQSQLTSCAGSISQAAGVAALTQVEESELDEAVAVMKSKRDYVLGELESMVGVKVTAKPNGAFYVLLDVSSMFGGDDTELCLELLKSKKLALVPGSSFGAPGTVRISYATSMEELKTAMRKLGEFAQEHKA